MSRLFRLMETLCAYSIRCSASLGIGNWELENSPGSARGVDDGARHGPIRNDIPRCYVRSCTPSDGPAKIEDLCYSRSRDSLPILALSAADWPHQLSDAFARGVHNAAGHGLWVCRSTTPEPLIASPFARVPALASEQLVISR